MCCEVQSETHAERTIPRICNQDDISFSSGEVIEIFRSGQLPLHHSASRSFIHLYRYSQERLHNPEIYIPQGCIRPFILPRQPPKLPNPRAEPRLTGTRVPKPSSKLTNHHVCFQHVRVAKRGTVSQVRYLGGENRKS